MTSSPPNFDYLPVSTSIHRSQLTTTGSAAVVGCIDISVIDDDMKEREERFTVQVTNGSVVLGRVTVTIESSDSNYLATFFKNWSNVCSTY